MKRISVRGKIKNYDGKLEKIDSMLIRSIDNDWVTFDYFMTDETSGRVIKGWETVPMKNIIGIEEGVKHEL